MEATMFHQQRDTERPIGRSDSLYGPSRDGLARGPYSGHVKKSSVYTTAMLSDVTRVLPFLAAGVALAAGMRRYNS
jgi:hypothetical protein